jgi:SAM-dependent methyltransferase
MRKFRIESQGMSQSDDREHWNRKYLEKPDAWRDPDPFLIEAYESHIGPLFPQCGTALDVAGGAGRHSIWLAERGWDVTLIDISDIGVELARRNAGPFESHIHFVVDDLTSLRASQTQFDLVMGFYYLERKIFPGILKALKPGGLLVYKTYTVDQIGKRGGPRSFTLFLLARDELCKLMNGLEILLYREIVCERATVEAVARNT